MQFRPLRAACPRASDVEPALDIVLMELVKLRVQQVAPALLAGGTGRFCGYPPPNCGPSMSFTDREKAALRFADVLTRAPGLPLPEECSAIAELFTPAEIAELGRTVARLNGRGEELPAGFVLASAGTMEPLPEPLVRKAVTQRR